MNDVDLRELLAESVTETPYISEVNQALRPFQTRTPEVRYVYAPSPVEAVPAKHPGLDPLAQRLVGAGVALAGLGAAGWGLSLAFEALAKATTALGLILGIVGVVAYMRGSSGGRHNASPINVSVRV